MIDFFPIYANGERIGSVTSACYSPRLEKNIGYAMVPIEFAEPGTELAGCVCSSPLRRGLDGSISITCSLGIPTSDRASAQILIR
jgi:hypothetical protein